MAVEVNSWVGHVVGAGRYRVLSRLGAGGMGLVYLAHDNHLDTRVVIKVPRLAMLDDPDFAHRFDREVRSLVRLSHPHIVQILATGDHRGLPFAVLQYLSGGDLNRRRTAASDEAYQPLPPDQLRGWLLPVAKALDFVHAQGCIHRDVKPENILFDAHGNAYISDFGVAKVVGGRKETRQTAATGTGLVLGTVQYMAPEMVRAEPFDGKVDQYALAVTVYEVLSGRFPIDGPSGPLIMMRHLTDVPVSLRELVPGLPTGLAEAVQRGLEKDPARRFACCTEFAHALLTHVAPPVRASRKAAPSRPSASPRAQPKPPRPTAARGRSWLMLGGGFAAVLLVGVLVMLALSGRQAPIPPQKQGERVASTTGLVKEVAEPRKESPGVAAVSPEVPGEDLFQRGLKFAEGRNQAVVNQAEAARYFAQAGEQGHPLAPAWLAALLFVAERGLPDKTEAERLARRSLPRVKIAARNGDRSAQLILGVHLALGIGGEKSDREAIDWLRKASDQGEPGAQVWLGRMLADGRGVARKDDSEAAGWFRKAAANGHPEGLAWLGMMHLQGRGVPREDNEAGRLLRQAVDRGSLTGQAFLGEMYAAGRGVPQDESKALACYRAAAEAGNSWGQAFLGQFQETGRGGLTSNVTEALRLYRQAADGDNAVAQARLGILHAQGQGVPKDEKEALAWLLRAAANGSTEAPTWLGRLYRDGEMVRNRQEALRWFRRAADNGDMTGQYYLGLMTLGGEASPRDQREGLRWLRQAANQGHAEARQKLQELGVQ